ncbi:glutaredoxin family protein [Simplicispira psychrophila]|uniref:glutaredoxin family protein n=1 Tax=Simplicispira psychrophila TaxID=80882 RepID=UPI000560954B|nr:glutaredoxin family protein [Simplicispira psychrophila]
MHLPAHTTLTLAAALCALACSSLVQAQPVYRIVGPDGKVTFSDRAPNEDAKPTRAADTPASADGSSALPYTLRQVASRFPVTLYTAADCAPCTSARNLLVGRGVPFTERSVSSNEDIVELGRLGGGSSLPFGTIGGQHLTGFSDSEWTQYLDAAGYPKKSELPSNYRQPAAMPLVAVKPVVPAAAAAQTPPRDALRPAPTTPTGPGPSNPAGIRF